MTVRIPIDRSGETEPLPAREFVPRTPIVGARGWFCDGGIRETCTGVDLSVRRREGRILLSTLRLRFNLLPKSLTQTSTDHRIHVAHAIRGKGDRMHALTEHNPTRDGAP